jgi:hypothetical protein
VAFDGLLDVFAGLVVAVAVGSLLAVVRLVVVLVVTVALVMLALVRLDLSLVMTSAVV